MAVVNGIFNEERESATEFSRLGGFSRAESLTPEERSAIASNAARVRWENYTKLPKTSSLPYYITSEEYEELKYAQNDVCAICKQTSRDAQGKAIKLYVDHCHETGKVRGLLCNLCNSMLGFGKDNSEILRNAADYLESASMKNNIKLKAQASKSKSVESASISKHAKILGSLGGRPKKEI